MWNLFAYLLLAAFVAAGLGTMALWSWLTLADLHRADRGRRGERRAATGRERPQSVTAGS